MNASRMVNAPPGWSFVLRGRAKRSASQRIGAMLVTSRTMSMDFRPRGEEREWSVISFLTFVEKKVDCLDRGAISRPLLRVIRRRRTYCILLEVFFEKDLVEDV